MSELFDLLTSTSYWDSVVRLAAPIVLAALACLLASRSGMLFVGVEGVMIFGAFGSVAAAAKTDSIILGVLAGLLAGVAGGLLFGWLSIYLRAGDVVSGLVVTFGALGVTSFLVQRWFPAGAVIAGDRLRAPWDLDGPGIVFILEQQPLVYLSIVSAIGISLFLRTRVGLRLRACGEAMRVADGLAISIGRTRLLAAAVAGAFAGLAGTSLGLAVVGSFDRDPVAGRGFIALTCVILGAWRAPWVVVAGVFFAAADAFRFQTTIAGSRTWGPLLPYIVTLLALATIQRRGKEGPADEGRSIDELRTADRADTRHQKSADPVAVPSGGGV